MNFISLGAIFIGGGLGSLVRFGVMNLVSHTLGARLFPWPTLVVNLLGAFIIGILLELLALRLTIPSQAKLFLVTGFLGGFTTFSAFSLEGALMVERADYVMLLSYIGCSVIGTICAVFLGSGLIKLYLP